MATRKLGDVAVGSIVKLKENGSTVNYIVVHQGKPSDIYDNSCDGTWLLRKDIVEFLPRDSDGAQKYETSSIKSWLDSTMYGRYDSNIRNAIKIVKIPYVSGGAYGNLQTGNSGLQCKVFLLSVAELGVKSINIGEPFADGAKLDYFLSDPSNDYQNKEALAKRIASYQGSNNSWWVRSIFTRTPTAGVPFVHTDGWIGQVSGTFTYDGVRPAIVLSKDAYIDSYNNVFINLPPSMPQSIIIPETIRGGKNLTVSWPASSDPDGNLDGCLLYTSHPIELPGRDRPGRAGGQPHPVR